MASSYQAAVEHLYALGHELASVPSHRFDLAHMRALLAALAGATGAARAARFVCVVALATPQAAVVTKRGECRGRILEAPRGADGFGYDPVFVASGTQVSFAELPEADKGRLSHRGNAVRALIPELRRAFGG